MKYIFITGGVISSLGKGITAASIAALLERRGLKISMLKLDPYLNVDPGTMNPLQHGEVYVTDDGAETDLDLGHYYRFSNAHISKNSNVTAGQTYERVIKNERKGAYLGKTVQVIPHVTDEIKKSILNCENSEDGVADVTIVEIGGTVGDIESQPFLEAIRQFRQEHKDQCLNIHLTYIPYLSMVGEVKTKPTQHSVQTLRSIGIIPDIIVCRCKENLPEDIKAKISLFCSVSQDSVIDAIDVKHSIYEIPLFLHEQNLDNKICKLLSLKCKKIDLTDWEKLIKIIRCPKDKVTIAIVGKYLSHEDSYKSVFEALQHAAISHGICVELKKIDSEKYNEEPELKKLLTKCDACLVPGGFGKRGFEGMVLAAKICREKDIPYFGICLGMQVLCVEFARDILKLSDANSTEMEPETQNPVISLLPDQEAVEDLGGTMRLGAYECKLNPKSKIYKIYKKPFISERHRHRFEFNNKYRKDFEKHGLLISGVLDSKNICETVEVKGHPWMIGVQYHPEFKSKLTAPHPLFKDFIAAALKRKKK